MVKQVAYRVQFRSNLMINHFQVYFGKPKQLDFDCMMENLSRNPVLLHADTHWGFEQPIDNRFLDYPACRKLVDANPHPAHRSAVYRSWFLWHNPDYCYLDSDCINYGWTLEDVKTLFDRHSQDTTRTIERHAPKNVTLR